VSLKPLRRQDAQVRVARAALAQAMAEMLRKD
jgi:hypothetical protein